MHKVAILILFTHATKYFQYDFHTFQEINLVFDFLCSVDNRLLAHLSFLINLFVFRIKHVSWLSKYKSNNNKWKLSQSKFDTHNTKPQYNINIFRNRLVEKCTIILNNEKDLTKILHIAGIRDPTVCISTISYAKVTEIKQQQEDYSKSRRNLVK